MGAIRARVQVSDSCGLCHQVKAYQEVVRILHQNWLSITCNLYDPILYDCNFCSF